jgi:hypothetical protein
MEVMSAPSNPTLRIGNDERDAAIKALDEHLNAGRLDAEEYGQRVAQASTARTREGIDELFVDLPAPHPFGAPAPPPSWGIGRIGPAARPRVVADQAWRRFSTQGLVVRVLALVLAAIVVIVAIPFAVVGAVLFFVVFPMLGLGPWHHGRARYRKRWRY